MTRREVGVVLLAAALGVAVGLSVLAIYLLL
jgi:hypothetical protein